jgi:plasmid stabilization system protein ParE
VIVRLVDEADADVREARRWYRRQQSDLASRFMRAVESGLQLISEYPEAQPRTYGTMRRLLISGFPYALIYILDADVIVVLGCFHTARDPAVWQERADQYLP